MYESRQSTPRKNIAKTMYAFSAFLAVFSFLTLAMTFSVGSMKRILAEVDRPAPGQATPSPRLMALCSINFNFPEEFIRTKDGKTLKERLMRFWHIAVEKDERKRRELIEQDGLKNNATCNVIRDDGPGVDPGYCEKFWNMNERARSEISRAAAGDFSFAGATAEVIASLQMKGATSQEAMIRRIFNARHYSASMTRVAVFRGDYAFALDEYVASLQFGETARIVYSAPTTAGLSFRMSVAEGDKYTSDLFLSDGAFFASSKMVARFAKAIGSRMETFDEMPTFAAAITEESRLIRNVSAALPFRDKLALGALDLWYGDPHGPFHEVAREIAISKRTDYSAYFDIMNAAMARHPRPASFTRELAYTGDSIVDLFRFVKFAVSTHPLASSTHHFPIFDLDRTAKSDAHSRTVTLGALARLFYYENGRWPDLSKDAEFVKNAGKAATDPYTNTPMRTKILADGSLSIYCHWKDGTGKPAETSATMIRAIAMPVNVKR